MNEVTERVRILVETIATKTGALDAVAKKMGIMRMNIRKASQALAQQNLMMARATFAGSASKEEMNGMKDTAHDMKQEIISLNKSMNPLINRQRKLKQNLRNTNKELKSGGGATRKLRMEFLGVMFFGMMIQRTFMSMLKPAMEVFGIFELWQSMLQVLFIPIISALFPLFLDMINFFMDMDPAIKMMIGGLAVALVALGTFLMSVGQLALGMGALEVALLGSEIAKTAPHLASVAKSMKSLVGLGLIVFGLTLTFTSSIYDDEMGFFKALMGSAISGIGTWIMFGPTVGNLYIAAAVFTVTMTVKMIYDTVMQPGIDVWKTILTSAFAGTGAFLAAILAGATVATAGFAAGVAISATMVITWGLEMLFEGLNKPSEEISGSIANWSKGRGANIPTRYGSAGAIGNGGNRFGIDTTGGSGGGSITNNINVNVQDKGVWERWADDFARKQRDELSRMTGG